MGSCCFNPELAVKLGLAKSLGSPGLQVMIPTAETLL